MQAPTTCAATRCCSPSAVRLINQRAPVYGGILVGGGTASFEHERIAAATLAEVCDEGTVTIDGLDPSVPVGAVA